MTIEFNVNGKTFQTENKFNIFELVNYLNLLTYPIAIEINGIFISKNHWTMAKIENLDTIEIVTIVGGG